MSNRFRTVTIGRRGIGRSIHPLRVELRRPETHRRLYEDHFECPVRFDARRNRVVFRVEDVDQPFVTHNPDLLELVAPQLDAELKRQLSAGSVKEQAKGILKRLLAGERPRGWRMWRANSASAAGLCSGVSSTKA